jgi:plastocyanin
MSLRRTSFALILLLAPAVARAGELSGTVQLLAKGGKMTDRTADVRTAVVVYRPQAGVRGVTSNQTFSMVTRKKEFVPRVLAVPVGSTVWFPNEDPILHNVFSVSGENRFDLGLYRKGPGKSWKLQKPGVVRVFCNVHHSMVAYIVVLDSPYFALPDGAGNFTLKGVPDGAGTLEVWHEQAELTRLETRVPAPAALFARLEVSKPRLPAHLNKNGQSYRSDRGDAY